MSSPSSRPRSAIVFICDGVRPDFLGPYGNTWFDTPGFNRLAAESLLVEFGIAESLDLTAAYESYLRGTHAAVPNLATSDTLLQKLQAENVVSRFVTDDDQFGQSHIVEEFDECIVVPAPESAVAVEEIEDTQLARLTAATIEILAEISQPTLLWVHAKGMRGYWDAPYSMRESLASEDDPPPPDFVDSPHATLPPETDPDFLLGLNQAYGAQVMVLDRCIEWLRNAVVDCPESAGEIAFFFSSPRGYALGEHHLVGDAGSTYSESVAIPALFRLPHPRSTRMQSLFQPQDIGATLLDAIGGATNSVQIGPYGARSLLSAGKRIRAVCSHQKQLAIRTPAWYLRAQSLEGEFVAKELFVKPDDRLDVNDVIELCDDESESLRLELQHVQDALIAGEYDQLPPLESDLCNQIR